MSVHFLKLLFVLNYFCFVICSERKASRGNCEETNFYEHLKDGVEDNIVVLKAVTEGEKLKLDCEYCGQKVIHKEVVWKRRKFYENVANFVHIDNYFDKLDNRVILGKSNSLIMKSAKEEDSGFYYCVNAVDNKTSTEYLVDVQIQSPLDAVVGNDSDFDSFIDEYINSLNTSFLTGLFKVNASSTSLTNETLYFDTSKYLIGMHWGQWTMCIPCGTANGEQRREAHCRLYHKVRLRLLLYNQTLDIPQPSVGCRSKLLENIPKLALLLKTIPDFVSTRSCHVKCTEKFYGENIALQSNIFQRGSEAKKKFKKYLRRLKQSKDVTAAPVIEPSSFPLSSVVEFEGSRIHIRCPGVVARSRVDWYFKYHLLHSHITELQTRGRVRIDSKNHRISFRPLKQSDSGVYTCIVYGIQKGNIELRVLKYKTGFDVRSPIGAMKVASIASTALFTVLTCIRLICRLRKRKH
ncbi:hypothetical protein B4U80_13667 [Leptotrombidium deliense]|uniref:Ig-like domain-containing protein n=1 Tax=Leptotrombidium deliense TaxID=299467 RepID=A0A443SN17_9ACAR|nr:hypothetical protein B4U80_13667 [Leptotrombidium deliense]